MKEILFYSLLLAFVFLLSACGDNDGTPVPSPGPNPSTYTNHHISASGGTYTIDQNFVITIPAGAIPSDTTISVAKLATQTMKAVFTNYGVADFPVVAGFDLQPAGLTFSKPVTFTFKSLTHTAPYVPITHTVNLSDNTHSIDSCITLVDNMNDSLCISVVRSGSYIVEALRNWPGGLAKYSRIAGCKEGVIEVTSRDKDHQCSSGNCQLVESKITVQFKSCNGQPIESAIERETSGLCDPTLTLTPSASEISKNSSTSIKALLKIGCVEAEGDTITYEVSGPSGVNIDPKIVRTDAGGQATVTLSSGDEAGTATVKAKAKVRIPVRVIIINGSVEEAFYRIIENVSAQTSVKINDSIWHVDLTVSANDNSIWVPCAHAFIDYSTHIEFDCKIDTAEGTFAEIVVPGTQSVSIQTGNCQGETVVSANTPSAITFHIFVRIQNGNVCFMIGDPESDVYQLAQFVLKVVHSDGDIEYEDWFLLGICVFREELFSFPIDKNSYLISGTSLVWGGGAAARGTYTLTVTKKETP
jgi:hypothetical protein